MKKPIEKQIIRVDVGTDYLDKEDLNFLSIEGAILAAYRISKDRKIPVRVIMDTSFGDHDYQETIIARISPNIFSDKSLYNSEICDIKID